MLANYDVAILAENDLSAGQVSTLTDWVQGGGNLIAMRPDPQLSGLLGLNDASGTLSNAYLKVDTSTGPGAGIVDQTIQFHGTADRYTTSGAQTIASLYSDANTATPNPAVTMRSVGPNGGQAAAFSYDLARSVIYTRQGNPAWSGDERDGSAPIRSDDLFFGGQAGRPPARLGRPQQGRDPAGRRAAAAARQPDRADERRPQAAAAVLVPAARREGGGGDDRGRSRKRRHRRALRRVRRAGAQRLLGRRLAVRAGHLLHLPRHPGAQRLRGGRLPSRRL